METCERYNEVLAFHLIDDYPYFYVKDVSLQVDNLQSHSLKFDMADVSIISFHFACYGYNVDSFLYTL